MSYLQVIMAVKKKIKKNKDKKLSLLERLRKKDRLVVVDLKTYEEIRHFNFSGLSLIIYTLFFTLIIISATWAFIAFTPIKQIIPGYPDISKQKKLAYDTKNNLDWINKKKAQLDREHIYYRNLQIILSDSIVNDSIALANIDSTILLAQDFSTSEKDSILRNKIEEQEKYLINNPASTKNTREDLKGVLFFSPIRGSVSDSMNVKKGHFGIDIIAPKDETVKSILAGAVIFTDWTPDNGNVMYIQHNYNLVSVYKHNSILLKKVGEFVKTGEPIAVIGNSGRLSTGPHLHLELWHKGIPLNPLDYINL